VANETGRPRPRDIGLRLGTMEPGPLNAITDVAGVRVGQTTLISGSGPLVPGHGPVRTGVTVILPHGGNLFREKVPGAVHVINGFGKCRSRSWARSRDR
jgi:D-aminopeptidase